MTAVKKITQVTAPAGGAAEKPAADADWNKKILIVDDEPELRSIYKEILKPPPAAAPAVQSSRSAKLVAIQPELERYSFDVLEAGSAKEALLIAEKVRNEGGSFAMGFFDVKLGEGMD